MKSLSIVWQWSLHRRYKQTQQKKNNNKNVRGKKYSSNVPEHHRERVM